MAPEWNTTWGAHGGKPAVSREQGIVEIAGAGDDGRDRYRFQGQGLLLVDRGQLVADDLEGDRDPRKAVFSIYPNRQRPGPVHNRLLPVITLS